MRTHKGKLLLALLIASIGGSGDFCGNAAYAAESLRWGFVDRTGKMVIDAQFDEAGVFAEGLAAVRHTVDGNTCWGFVDASGKVVIDGFDEVTGFRDGLAAVKIPSSGPLVDKLGADYAGLWGFIDKSGEYQIKPRFQAARAFSQGVAAAAENGKYGFVDRSGAWVIQPRFDLACSFSCGRAAVLENEGTGFLSLRVGEDVYRAKGARWYYIDMHGDAVDGMFEECGAYSDGVAPVAVGKFQGADRPDKWGFISAKGRFVIKPMFYDVHAMSEGKAAVQTGVWKKMGRGYRSWFTGRWGYVDKKGRQVIPAQFDGADPFSEGLAAVKLNGKWGYIDERGKIVIEPKFVGNLSFGQGMAPVAVRIKTDN